MFAKVLQDFIKRRPKDSLNTQLQEFLQEYKSTDDDAYDRIFLQKAVCLWRIYSIQKHIVEIISLSGNENISRLVLHKKVHSDNPASHFLPSFSRIMYKGYNPTLEDILSVRIPTTGIRIYNFNCAMKVEMHRGSRNTMKTGLTENHLNEISKIWFILYLGVMETYLRREKRSICLIDVGGQRSERRKWIHLFDGVNALIFVVAMSEYDETLLEVNTVNRMHESLRLFGSIR